MRVVYSIGAKFGGAGIGNIAFHAASGIHRAGQLERLFVSSNAQRLIPPNRISQGGTFGRGLKYLAFKEKTGLVSYVDNVLFDWWVALQLPSGDIFHGWNGMCLRSLRRAKRLGMKTIVERASSHPTTQLALLRDEYARWKVPLKLPMWNHARSISEIAETDYVTVPSAFARESMIANGVPPDKLIEIPFGVDLDRFKPTANIASHPFRVIFVGQVSIRKGVQYLLEAWYRLHWSDADLWIVGQVSPDFVSLHERWMDTPRVKWIAHSNNVHQLMQQGDVFVFPSLEEGSALVTYEAMASGLPVITTPNAGSVVRDRTDGFIVPIREVDALMGRMQELRADAARCKRMGECARERVREFTWDAYRTRLLQAYRQILQAK